MSWRKVVLALGAAVFLGQLVVLVGRPIAERQAMQVPGLTAPLPTPSGPIARGPLGPVVGPTFGPHEQLETMPGGWLGVAFRVPSNWECVGSSTSYGGIAYCF